MKLGAGRENKDSKIDLSVGIVLAKKRGDKVSKGETIATIHANSEEKFNEAEIELFNNIDIFDKYSSHYFLYFVHNAVLHQIQLSE